MAKEEQKFESNITRKNVKVSAKIGNRALVFGYDDTLLCEFPAPFEHFNHIFHTMAHGMGKSALYAFYTEHPEAAELLKANNFPTDIRPHPSVQDEEMFLKFSDQKLQRDLEAFERGED